MQQKEEETRVGGREVWPIKIIETAGRTLEQTLVNTDPFGGNLCSDPKCLPSKDPKNKINCRRNTVCYRITCLLCLKLKLKLITMFTMTLLATLASLERMYIVA